MRQTHGGHCSICRRADRALQVHHLFYEPGRELWEYGDQEVIVICAPCHRELHAELQRFRKHIFSKLSPAHFKILNGALAVGLEQYDPMVLVHAFAEFVSTPSLVRRYAEAWGFDEKGKPTQPNVPDFNT